MKISGHAYPWDVLADPTFPGRVTGHGIGAVTLAAAYHSVRAATPLHPAHRIVDARYAALYRTVRADAWAGHRLAPKGPQWIDEPDPFGSAATILDSAGIEVTAWVVLTHNSRLGTAHPDLAVRNCFGETYRYALCPNQSEVRRYAATLAAEAVRDAPVRGISLEACGQLGVTHLSHHDKTAGAWSVDEARRLSVCCCAACRSAWRANGLDPDRVVTGLAAGDGYVDDRVAEVLLAVRHAGTDALRAEVLAAVRTVAPGITVTVHADPDPWATGPSPGMTAAASVGVDRFLVPAWPINSGSTDTVEAAARFGLPVDAYLTVLSEPDTEAIVAHAARLIASGADGLALYHLGLAPAAKQTALAAVTAGCGDSENP